MKEQLIEECAGYARRGSAMRYAVASEILRWLDQCKSHAELTGAGKAAAYAYATEHHVDARECVQFALSITRRFETYYG